MSPCMGKFLSFLCWRKIRLWWLFVDSLSQHGDTFLYPPNPGVRMLALVVEARRILLQLSIRHPNTVSYRLSGPLHFITNELSRLSPALPRISSTSCYKSLYIRLYLCISRPKSGSSPDHFVLISMLSLFYSTGWYMGWIAYTCTLFTLLVRIVNATFWWLFDSFQSGVFGKQCLQN